MHAEKDREVGAMSGVKGVPSKDAPSNHSASSGLMCQITTDKKNAIKQKITIIKTR